MNRRNFLRNGAMGMAAFTILPRNVLGGTNFVAPSDQFGIGIIGCGTQGRIVGSSFATKPDANIIALADCESLRLPFTQNLIDKATETAKGQAFKGIKLYSDYKELLANKDIDGVIITTPDHWHAMITIDACRAGKDVYCEKPMSHSLAEGRAMANAVKKYDRILQVGNMQRSWTKFRHACELVRNGYIGNIKEIKVNVGPPPVKYNLPGQPVPKTLNWERWIGPAPMNPYNEELIFPLERRGYPNWREYKEYGGGMICDWGTHMFDIAQWAMGMDNSGPIEFIPADPKKSRPLTMRYANGTIMTHEPFRRAGNAVRFIGENGVIDISRGFLETIPTSLQDQVIGANEIKLQDTDKIILTQGEAESQHHSDFLNSMKTRKQPLSTVEIGHRTVSLCHIINLCYELNRTLQWNPVREEFAYYDTEANSLRNTPYRAGFKLEV